MTISAISPAANAVVSSATISLSATVTGWTPTSVWFLFGSGRYPIEGTHQGGGVYTASFNTATTAYSGSTGGQVPESVWNHAQTLTVAAYGAQAETSDPHYFFVIKVSDPSPATSFAWRSALAFEADYSGTVADFRDSYLDEGGSSVGESMASIVTDPHDPSRRAVLMNPDPAGDLTDQPTSGGLRCQFQTPPVIVAGDYFCVGAAFMLPADYTESTTQDHHIALAQFYGPDDYAGNSYNFGATLTITNTPRTNLDGSYIENTKDSLRIGGNSQNPGFQVPLWFRQIGAGGRGKWIDTVIEGSVSTDPRYGWIRVWVNDGSSDSVQPVRQPLPYPGTEDYTRAPFVWVTGWHDPQRFDMQCYGDRNDHPDWDHVRIYGTGHKIAATVAEADPGSYSDGPSLPAGYEVAPGFQIVTTDGLVAIP